MDHFGSPDCLLFSQIAQHLSEVLLGNVGAFAQSSLGIQVI